MDNVIKLEDFLPKLDGEGDLARERFLLEEGLNLLAAFRSIPDVEVRRALYDTIKTVAEVSKRERSAR